MYFNTNLVSTLPTSRNLREVSTDHCDPGEFSTLLWDPLLPDSPLLWDPLLPDSPLLWDPHTNSKNK